MRILNVFLTIVAAASTSVTVDTQRASGAGTTVGVDQMPASAQFRVSGRAPDDKWNGSWTITSSTHSCGINTFPKMINFGIADIDDTRGDFQELTIGSNDGPAVGGSTSNFSVTLGLDRRLVPNLNIRPGQTAGDTGTLTVVENANGNSRVRVTARSSRGVQFEGEFTCVPRR